MNFEEKIGFKMLFDKAPVGVAVMDIQSDSFVQVNDKFCDIFGYTRENLYQADFRSISFSDSNAEDGLKMKKLKAGEIEEFSLLKRYNRSDGSLLWLNIIVKSLNNERIQPENYMVAVEDVTERKMTEYAASESLLRTSSLINTIDGIVWEANPDNFKFSFISKKTEEVLGYAVEEWLDSHTFWADHVHPEDRNWVVDYCTICTKALKAHDFEYRMIAKDGRVVWLRDIVNVIAIDNNPVLLRGIMIDITEQKKAQKTLRDSFVLVNEQNKRLLNFSYIVSHNLRSHTSNIQAITELIDISEAEPERKELVHLLKRASNSLNETLMNLNQVVNIQTSINIHIEPLNLENYIDKTIVTLNEEIIAKNVLIKKNDSCDLIINYNPAYLESILLNIIFNAIRYSHPDKRPVIEINCFKENNQQVLQISDNGIGIDLDKHGKELFGMYKTFTDHTDSKGIGLFISKNQIDAMGGRITVSSVVNEGTTFSIYFK